MTTRSAVRSRVTRQTLAVSLGVGLLAAAGAWRAAADAGESAGDCLTGYHAEGMSSATAQGVEIPQENVAAQPYALANLNDTPTSHARANNVYPGYIGQALYDTASNFTPDSPFAVEAWYPQPPKGTTADAHDDGPIGHTIALARPAESLAEAKTAFGGANEQLRMGPSMAHVDIKYTGDMLKGLNAASAYNVSLGPLHMDLVKSVVDWKSDGTDAGTVASWVVQFHGVTIDGKPVAGSDANGFSFQGGTPQPGSASMQQTQSQERQLSDALDKAGFAQVQVMPGGGSPRIDAGHIEINGTALTLRFAPTARRDNSGQAFSWQLGRTWLHVLVERGECFNAKPVPEGKTNTPPEGPNIPPYPPQNGGDPYHRPAAAAVADPPGPPGLPIPAGVGGGGKQAPRGEVSAAQPAGVVPEVLRELPLPVPGTLPDPPAGPALR